MNCKKCGSENVDTQFFREDLGSSTISKSKSSEKSKTKELGHGFLYWLFLGWWIWIFKLVFWIVFFIPMAILRLLRRKKTKTNSTSKETSVETTVNRIEYRTLYTCRDCGYVWKVVTK